MVNKLNTLMHIFGWSQWLQIIRNVSYFNQGNASNCFHFSTDLHMVYCIIQNSNFVPSCFSVRYHWSLHFVSYVNDLDLDARSQGARKHKVQSIYMEFGMLLRLADWKNLSHMFFFDQGKEPSMSFVWKKEKRKWVIHGNTLILKSCGAKLFLYYMRFFW